MASTCACLNVKLLSDCLNHIEKLFVNTQVLWNAGDMTIYAYLCSRWWWEITSITFQTLALKKHSVSYHRYVTQSKTKVGLGADQSKANGPVQLKSRIVFSWESKKNLLKQTRFILHTYLNARARSFNFVLCQWRPLRRLHLMVAWLYKLPKLKHSWNWDLW